MDSGLRNDRVKGRGGGRLWQNQQIRKKKPAFDFSLPLRSSLLQRHSNSGAPPLPRTALGPRRAGHEILLHLPARARAIGTIARPPPFH